MQYNVFLTASDVLIAVLRIALLLLFNFSICLIKGAISLFLIDVKCGRIRIHFSLQIVVLLVFLSLLALHTSPDEVKIVQKLFLVQNLLYVVKMIQKICFCKKCST